jgi:hypothetical protein
MFFLQEYKALSFGDPTAPIGHLNAPQYATHESAAVASASTRTDLSVQADKAVELPQRM